MRISPVENLRFPEEGSSTQGKSGPKPRLKSVGDGQQVIIPVLEVVVNREVGTQEDKLSVRMEEHVQIRRKRRQENPFS